MFKQRVALRAGFVSSLFACALAAGAGCSDDDDDSSANPQGAGGAQSGAAGSPSAGGSAGSSSGSAGVSEAEVQARLTTTLEQLAAIGPKRAGTPKGLEAGDYVKQRLEAAVGSAATLEAFSFLRQEVSKTELEVRLDGEVLSTMAHEAFAYTGVGRVDADVVDVGVGKPADYLNKDVVGKIVFVRRDPQFHRQAQYRQAALAGAAGLLYASQSPQNLIQTGTINEPEDGAAAFPTITIGKEDGAKVQATFAAGKPVHAVLDVAAQVVPAQGRNVIARVPGTDPSGAYLMIGAHYDTWHAGSTDNGTGVAVLLELAERLAAAPPGRLGVVLVGFDAEELGLFGGYDYLRRHVIEAGEPMLGFLNLEMPAGGPPSTLLRAVASTNAGPVKPASDAGGLKALYPLSAGLDSVPLLFGGLIPTDIQGMYWYGLQGMTTYCETDYYHTTQDTPDKIDTAFLARVALSLVDTVKVLDNEPLQSFKVLDPELWAPAHTTSLLPDGSRDVTVTAKDASGVPQPGAFVRVWVDVDDFTRSFEQTVTTDANGVATVRVPAAALSAGEGKGSRWLHFTTGETYPLAERLERLPLERFRGRPRGAPARGSVVGVELRVALGHLDEQGRGGPARAEAVFVRAHPSQDLGRPDAVDVAKGPAPKRRKAQPEDRADVTVARRAHDALAEAAQGLVDELQRAAHLHLFERHRARPGLDPEQPIETRVDRLAFCAGKRVATPRGAGGLAVEVDAAPVLAPLAPVGREARDRGRRRHALAEGLDHDEADVRGDVDAHLVEQGQGPDGPAPEHEGAVDLGDRHALGDEEGGFVQVGAEDAARVETDAVVDDDDGLALPLAERHGGRHRGGRTRRGADDLEQRHFVHRAEIMHPHDVLGAAGAGGDLRDGQRRGVRGEDGVGAGNRLDLGEHATLEGEVFEDRLDDDVGAREARVVGRGRDPAEPPRPLGGRERAALQALVVETRDVLEAAGERFVVAVFEPHVEAGVARDVGDAGAHQPRAEHGHLRHRPRRLAALFLERRRGEEEPHQPRRCLAHHQLAEGPRLDLARGGVAPGGVRLEHVENALDRGVVPEGLRERPRAGLPEEQGAAERVRLEGERPRAGAAPGGGAGAAFGEGERALGRGVAQDGAGHDLVDQAEPRGLRRAQALARQAEVERGGEPGAVGHTLQAVGPGQQAEPHFGQAEDGLRVVGRHAPMAGERQLEAAAEAGPVHRADHRLGALGEARERRLPVAAQPLGLGGQAHGLQHADVGADDERVGLA